MKSTNFYEQNAVLAKNIRFLEHSELHFLKKLRFRGYSIMGGTALCKLRYFNIPVKNPTAFPRQKNALVWALLMLPLQSQLISNLQLTVSIWNVSLLGLVYC